MTDSESSDTPEYDEPRILLVDMNEETAGLLAEEGFNVADASLGKPYKVDKEAKYHRVVQNANFPRDYKEHDIVVLDMSFEVQDEKDTRPDLAQDVDGWWASHHRGYVNPRPLLGGQVQDDFDRILNNEGVFIIFADRVDRHKFRWGTKKGSFNEFYGEKPITVGNWNFLSLLSQVSVTNDFGSFVEVVEGEGPLVQLLSAHSSEADFECVVSPRYEVKEKWLGLLENKFGRTVGTAILPDEEKGREGFVFVFPQIQNKGEFTAELIKEVLPV